MPTAGSPELYHPELTVQPSSQGLPWCRPLPGNSTCGSAQEARVGPGMMPQWLNPTLTGIEIPYRYRFVSRLLYFSSSSLLIGWESSRG